MTMTLSGLVTTHSLKEVRQISPTRVGLFLPPCSPAENELVIFILFALAVETLVLVCVWPLMEELHWGAVRVQTLTQAAFRLAFVDSLGLRQHGALNIQAGEILQRHAGWKENRIKNTIVTFIKM